MPERDGPPDPVVSTIHRALVLLILVNVGGSVLNTVPEITAAYDLVFDAIQNISLGIFAAEYLLRFWIAPGKSGTHDKIRLAGALQMDGESCRADRFVRHHAVLVLMRLLRFFKIARYSPAFHSLVDAVRAERHAVVACLMILASGILISAGFLYVLELQAQPDKFGSIPDAMWAVVTVTTVGYGDVVPVTVMGRFVGGITMVLDPREVRLLFGTFPEVAQRASEL